MEFIELDLEDEAMLIALLPHYQNYEAEISDEAVEDIFPPDDHEENFEYFMEYFGRGYTTYLCMLDAEFKGFVCFHKVSEAAPGYAEGYEGWGHLAEIYTDKQSRGLGLGKTMAKKAEDELKMLNVNSIYLTDISDNGGFWKSLGYMDTGKIEPEEGGRIYEKHI